MTKLVVGGQKSQLTLVTSHLLEGEKEILIFKWDISLQPFFNGKLILQESAAATGRSASGGATVTSTLFATHAAAIMPSPAEQVTDDLVSPKYDSEDDASEEEDESDDTVYECPGLAAPGQGGCSTLGDPGQVTSPGGEVG